MTFAQQERLDNWQLHDSQRGWFAREMYRVMAENERVWLITPDLGYKVLDAMREDFPDRFLNTGASEQAAMGICVGLALEGQIPFLYSITTFLLFRSFEWIRNYLHHEGIPVRLVGSGLNDDYKHDGFTHHSHDAIRTLNLFPGIELYLPCQKEDVAAALHSMVNNDKPSFMALRR